MSLQEGVWGLQRGGQNPLSLVTYADFLSEVRTLQDLVIKKLKVQCFPSPLPQESSLPDLTPESAQEGGAWGAAPPPPQPRIRVEPSSPF